MSEQQKVFASLSGSVIGHLLLFIVVFFFLTSSRTRDDLSSADQDKKGPKEVTIMMSEFMEQVETIEPEQEIPEPDPVIPDLPKAKTFINTDLNDPVTEKPENARFESDRSTVAATQLLPDESRPQVEGVTLNGANPSKNLQLEDRKFTDGPEVGRAASSASNREDNSESFPDPVGTATGKVAERMTRPEANAFLNSNQSATSEKSFVDPGAAADAPKLSTNEREKDQEASTDQESEEKGEVASPLSETTMAPEDSETDVDGASPGELQSKVNGTLTNRGENAVDVVETAVGKYKNTVLAAVSKRWQKSREEKRDSLDKGILKLVFTVRANGRVSGLKVTENDGNTVLTDMTLEAILEADIPPMPEEVNAELGAAGLEVKYDIIIY